MEDSESVCTQKPTKNVCSERILELEDRIKELESTAPKKYPEVKFLTYKDRKRILVSKSFFPDVF